MKQIKSSEELYITLGFIQLIFTWLIAFYGLTNLYDGIMMREDWKVRENSYFVDQGEFSLPTIAFQPPEPTEVHTLIDDRTDEEKFYHRIQSFAMELGDKFGVEPSMILAIAKKESRFNPDAVGNGAYGLMQIVTSVHKGRMQRLGVTNIMDPYENMLVAADILSYLYKKYDDPGLILMCYNLGEGGALSKFRNSGYSAYAKCVLGYKEEIERSESYGKICHQTKTASSDTGDSRTKMHRICVCPSSGAVR